MIISFIRNPKIIKGFQILFALFLAYFAIRLFIYHYYLLSFPYPNTYREGASMATATLLLHGVKPYNFILEPQYTNIYGIVYPLIALPFVKFLGESVVVYRAVTAFFIFASCLVIFLVLYKKKVPLLLNFWAILILYASFLFPLTSTPCVDPASTGLFFMLLAIFIPFLLNYSYFSLFISIICSLLAFYTKAYFFLGLPVMVSYLFFFVSRKKSMLMAFGGLVCFAISAVVMNHFFLSYFDDCFFIHNNYAAATSMTIVLNKQLHQFFDLNKGIFFLMSVLCAYNLVNWLKAHKIGNFSLIIPQLPLEIYAGICFAIVLISVMGKHFGANLWYFFQLFSPFLVIFTACLAGRVTVWPVLFSFLLIYNLFSLTKDDSNKYFDKHPIGWSTMEMLVKSNRNILNSALIAPLMIKENKEVYDDGQTEYFSGGGQREKWISPFLKEDKRVDMAQGVYVNKVQDMMKEQRFDLLILEVNYPSKVITDSIKNYYKYVGPILLIVPQDRRLYLMTIWRRNV